ncbi:aldo/keto reductase [Lacipirellula limnantheis]|uniref:General stress protein 69 n=1 Tax=Lacipirellula limnantheis TaxID=2528024 RepID=A0A517TX15_9BACT|nr:aldo/keto reductase [Lacipirellula limnantheis]QDT72907.1 General stress protein 69 [Lacipirellula limnantheis]
MNISTSDPTADRRRLGRSSIEVSSVSLGCWPIAGVTSLDVNDADSIATVRASLAAGANFLDTAYCYGPHGESERLIRRALEGHAREEAIIATKGGIHYGADGKQAQDARPETLLRECDESLERLGVDHVELYYLHSPDPHVPVGDSAGAIQRLIDAGKTLTAGASNCTLVQLQEFHAVCPLSAVQLPYNMLQRDIEKETIPWCLAEGISVAAYWPLMKGLLAGRIGTETELAAGDNRKSYPMYQGEEFERNQAFVAKLREIATRLGRTVAQVAVNWTISQPGITTALCGAKRAWQIEETAAAMGWRLSSAELAEINAAIEARGPAAAKRLFQ